MMSKVFASRLAEAEKTESTKAAGSRLELSNSSALVGSSATALADATNKVNAIRVSWQRHSDDYTANDFAVALAEVERCSERKTGADNGLRLAERSVIYDDSSVALAVRELIETIIPSVPIHHTFIKDGSVQPLAKELPLTLIVQSGPAGYEKTGFLSGEVTVQFHRIDGLHQQLSANRIEEVAKKSGARITVHSITPRKTAMGVMDECRIKVLSVATKVPYIADVTTFYTSKVGLNIPADSLRPLLRRDEGIRMTQDLCYESHAATVYRDKTAVVSSEVDSTGLRTTVVDVSILYKRHEKTGLSLAECVNRAFGSMDGTFVNGVGRVTVVEKVQAESALWMDASRFSLNRAIPSTANTTIDASKTDLESVGQSVYRLTIESRTR